MAQSTNKPSIAANITRAVNYSRKLGVKVVDAQQSALETVSRVQDGVATTMPGRFTSVGQKQATVTRRAAEAYGASMRKALA